MLQKPDLTKEKSSRFFRFSMPKKGVSVTPPPPAPGLLSLASPRPLVRRSGASLTLATPPARRSVEYTKAGEVIEMKYTGSTDTHK